METDTGESLALLLAALLHPPRLLVTAEWASWVVECGSWCNQYSSTTQSFLAAQELGRRTAFPAFQDRTEIVLHVLFVPVGSGAPCARYVLIANRTLSLRGVSSVCLLFLAPFIRPHCHTSCSVIVCPCCSARAGLHSTTHRARCISRHREGRRWCTEQGCLPFLRGKRARRFRYSRPLCLGVSSWKGRFR